MLLEFISVPGMCFPYRGSADSQSFHARSSSPSFREANISLHTSCKVWFCYCFINSLPFCWSCPKFLHCSIIHFYFQPLFPTKSLTLTVSHLVTGGKLQQHSCNSPVWSISSSVCEREDLPLPFSLLLLVLLSVARTLAKALSLFSFCVHKPTFVVVPVISVQTECRNVLFTTTLIEFDFSFVPPFKQRGHVFFSEHFFFFLSIVT